MNDPRRIDELERAVRNLTRKLERLDDIHAVRADLIRERGH